VVPNDEGRQRVAGGVRLTRHPDQELHDRLRELDDYGVICASFNLLSFDLEPVLEADFNRVFLPMIALLVLAVMVAIRNLAEGVLAAVLLLIALATAISITTIFVPRWHFIAVIGVPMLLGTGLDYSIHLTFALRREQGNLRAVFRGTGMAIIFCALTTAIAFGSLLLASNQAIRQLGTVVSIGALVLAFFAVGVLPGLWVLLPGRRKQ
jgi:predicted RND superfamily exporter protein